MSTNLGTGPMNLIQEIVFIRLYTRVFRTGILETKVGGDSWQIYCPSDETQSFLYSYRSWLYETKPSEIARKEIPGLYPIPSLSNYLCEYLTKFYCNARWCDADRESWASLVAKVAGAHSLVDSKVTLTQSEASWVNKLDVWSGAIEIDPDTDERLRSVIPHNFKVMSGGLADDVVDEEVAREWADAARRVSDEERMSLVDAMVAIKRCGGDVEAAKTWIKRRGKWLR